jgi:hypothetical protein
MDYRKEIEKLLQHLKNEGWSRAAIEQDRGYAANYIDQMLSKGGNAKFLKSLQDLLNRILLQKAMPAHGNVMNEPQEQYGNSLSLLIQQQNKLIGSLNKQSETANAILKKLSESVVDKVENVDINLNDALARIDSLKMDVYSGRQVILQSLARLEKKPVNALLSEADNITISILSQQKKKQSKTSGKGN